MSKEGLEMRLTPVLTIEHCIFWSVFVIILAIASLTFVRLAIKKKKEIMNEENHLSYCKISVNILNMIGLNLFVYVIVLLN